MVITPLIVSATTMKQIFLTTINTISPIAMVMVTVIRAMSMP